MRISGRALREYVQLLGPLLGLVAGVWAVRLILSLLGAPVGLVRVFSVTVMSAVCILLAVLLIHVRRFGGYYSVIVSVFLLTFWSQLLIIAAIALTLFTGTGNIFTAPEYSGGRNVSAVAHILGHLTFGVGLGTLFGSAMGCVLFWMIRRVAPLQSQAPGVRRRDS